MNQQRHRMNQLVGRPTDGLAAMSSLASKHLCGGVSTKMIDFLIPLGPWPSFLPCTRSRITHPHPTSAAQTHARIAFAAVDSLCAHRASSLRTSAQSRTRSRIAFLLQSAAGAQHPTADSKR